MSNDLGTCGGGGWTLVMKMDDTKVFTEGIDHKNLLKKFTLGLGRGAIPHIWTSLMGKIFWP